MPDIVTTLCTRVPEGALLLDEPWPTDALGSSGGLKYLTQCRRWQSRQMVSPDTHVAVLCQAKQQGYTSDAEEPAGTLN